MTSQHYRRTFLNGRVTPNITHEDAMSCMRVLGTLNGYLVGLVYFSGETELTRLSPDVEIR